MPFSTMSTFFFFFDYVSKESFVLFVLYLLSDAFYQPTNKECHKYTHFLVFMHLLKYLSIIIKTLFCHELSPWSNCIKEQEKRKKEGF
ncbi:hypothetical protein EDC96DRAFT_34765 [Choanephora cucurbitarum]|nr:hypothetical protein EDC96DRAFT_34765 [Choanephora cucurbitarum]